MSSLVKFVLQRFLLLMMTSLAGIVCLWGGTLAEEVTSYSVLVSSWKKIKDGLFVFPITTDTILNGLSLEYTNETKQAETLKIEFDPFYQ